MGLTNREAYLELRSRYLRLVAALRSTREYNPETLDAIERILPPEALNVRRPSLRRPIRPDVHTATRRRKRGSGFGTRVSRAWNDRRNNVWSCANTNDSSSVTYNSSRARGTTRA